MSEFAQHARGLRFHRIVLKSVTLACAFVQMMAWQNVIELSVARLTPVDGDGLAQATLNALATTGVSVAFVVAAYRAVRCVEYTRVRVT
jgi:hypothetical protein